MSSTDQYDDALTSPETSTSWLISHLLVAEDTQLLPYCQNQLTGLRVHVRALFEAAVQNRPPSAAIVDAVNGNMQKISSAPALCFNESQGFFRQHTHPVTQLVEHAMALIADDAAGLLAGDDADLLAQCQSEPCDRFYLRTHARRRWCSTRCGDRARAARAHARKYHQPEGN